jgi:F-type H+-transporting ATPase subunit b
VKISGSMKKLGWMALVAGSMMVPAHGVWAQESAAKPAVAQQAAISPGTAASSEEAEYDETVEYKQSKMVKTIGHALGMKPDVAAIFFEWLNFAILASFLGWALLKTLPKVFRDRSSAIQKELADARSATEAASVRLNSVEERLAKLDGQIAEMKAQADNDAAAEEKRFRAAAEEEKQKILASAELEIAAATAAGQRQLQVYAAGLAIEQAARRLVITAETDRLLVQNFAQGLTDGKGGEN